MKEPSSELAFYFRTGLAAVVLVASAGIAVSLFRGGGEARINDAKAEAQAVQNHAEREVADQLQPAIDMALELAKLVAEAKNAGAERDIIRGLALPALQQRPENFGVSVVMEPDGFDGKDSEFAGKGPENDADGRFVPYYYNSDGNGVAIAPLVITAEAGADAWYSEPLHNRRPRLIAPYYYPVNGVDTLFATISVPIVADADPIGIVALDVKMDSLVKALRPHAQNAQTGKVEVALLSETGTWIVHPDDRRIGQSLQLTANSVDAFEDAEFGVAYSGFIAGHRALTYTHRIEGTGFTYLLIPITFKVVPESWTLVLRLPPIDIPPDTKNAMMVSAGIGVLALLWLVLLMVTDRSRPAMPRPKAPSVALSARSRRRQPTIERR